MQLNWIILALMLGVCSAKWTEIEFEELSEVVASSSLLVLDVRNRSELAEQGAIPGSVCVPLHELATAFDPDLTTDDEFVAIYDFARPDRQEELVITCQSGTRTLIAVDILENEFGFDALRAYLGSFNDWVHNGGQIVFPDLS